ncbi:hypothetical protein J2750_002218 [Methanococcoides alaskense]|uniref:Uncharacterized protein n=1 Tax=Methanococcoides alaskense TaxID=325778 RepID=A0AA90U175_9EURY|nr:hypothetical protein [Methanococcoides alaskense]
MGVKRKVMSEFKMDKNSEMEHELETILGELNNRNCHFFAYIPICNEQLKRNVIMIGIRT